MNQFRQTSLKEFRTHYTNLVAKLYSQEEISKTFVGKISLLHPLLIASLGLKVKYFVDEQSSGLICIGRKYSYIGYLEATDSDSYSHMISHCESECRRVSNQPIVAPVDLSLWFQHRLAEPQLQSKTKINNLVYSSVPISKDYYWKVMIESGKIVSTYFSAQRKDWEFILKENERFAKTFKTQDYRIETITPGIKDLPLLYVIYRMSKGVFSHHIGFENISFLTFLLSKILTPSHSPTQIMVLKKGRKVCGFLSFYIQSINGTKTMIMKTILILPKFRGQGLTRYFSYLAHHYATEQDCQNVIYSTILDGNKVSGMDKRNIEEFGRFSLFKVNN